jgi:hypothetical protein
MRDALAIHDRQLALHGGAGGVRDPGLLESALARRASITPTRVLGVIELAALYTAAIIRNHPFIDSNKRTGFVTGILFLNSTVLTSKPAKRMRRLSWDWRRARWMRPATRGFKTAGGIISRTGDSASLLLAAVACTSKHLPSLALS